MCGIVAYVTLEGTQQGNEQVNQSIDRLRHRGPDGSGVLVIPKDEMIGPSVILGHTRLAIVGSDDAIQPLEWKHGNKRFSLVHNGEIYNFRTLMRELNMVCSNRSLSDSEVLLTALVHRGIEWTLDNIRGQWAFILVESEATETGEVLRRIVLCRDPFGIKPLCYAFDEPRKRLAVCSEVQALPNDIGLCGPHDVLPCSYIEVSIQVGSVCSFSCCTKKYEALKLMSTSAQKNISHNEQLSEIRSLLVDAVSVRIPQVRFAVLLSGGLDSSLIAAIAADLVFPEALHTFTIVAAKREGDPSALDDDSHFARLVAEYAPNIVHEEVEFTFEDALGILPDAVKCLETTDCPMLRAGVPLYFLSKRISEKGFKVVLCGEGADEAMGGYRLFEEYSAKDKERFSQELKRRLFNIDTSELQRVDRSTSAHGLEARVPFMDIEYRKKMTHPSLGRIQKYLLRKAFDGYQSKISDKQILPDSVLYREKEQFADGVGRSWIAQLQNHAAKRFPGGPTKEHAERALYKSHLTPEYTTLIESRSARRRQYAQDGKIGKPGCSQPTRWYPVRDDPDLSGLDISREDATYFLHQVLGWSQGDARNFSPSLASLNKAIVSMIERVPFHNLTLLTRPRRPPTMAEVRQDMMSGIGGPCAVVNSFFAMILDRLGFGPHVYLLSCEINRRSDCHVAILLQFKGLRYFVDVANAKPYDRAVQLADTSTFSGLDGSFRWRLRHNEDSGLVELCHSDEKAISFHPARTVHYGSFRAMIARSRSDESFGPFLTGLRFCLYPDGASRILAVRDACIFDGSSTRLRSSAASERSILSIAGRAPFSRILGFKEMVGEAIVVLDTERPGWFARSQDILSKKGISPQKFEV